MILELSADETSAIQAALLGAVIESKKRADEYASNRELSQQYIHHGATCAALLKKLDMTNAVIEIVE